MRRKRNLTVFTSSVLSIVLLASCSSTSDINKLKTFSSSECETVKNVLDYVGLSMKDFTEKDYLSGEKLRRFTTSFNVLTSYQIEDLQDIAIKMCKSNKDYFIGKWYDRPYLREQHRSDGPDLYIIVDDKKKKSEKLVVEHVRKKIGKFRDLLGANYTKLISSIRNVDISSKSTIEVRVKYPDTKGMSKISGKNLRKKFLQDRIADIYSELFMLYKNNNSASSFVDNYFPGQLNRKQFMGIKGKIFEKMENFDLSYRHKKINHMYSILDSDHWYYTIGSSRAGVPDKEANLKSLVESKATRGDLLGFILLADSQVKPARVDKSTLVFKIIVDFPEIRRKYRFGKISDHIE